MANAAVVNHVRTARTTALDRCAGVLDTMEVCRKPSPAAIAEVEDFGDRHRPTAYCPDGSTRQGRTPGGRGGEERRRHLDLVRRNSAMDRNSVPEIITTTDLN